MSFSSAMPFTKAYNNLFLALFLIVFVIVVYFAVLTQYLDFRQKAQIIFLIDIAVYQSILSILLCGE